MLHQHASAQQAARNREHDEAQIFVESGELMQQEAVRFEFLNDLDDINSDKGRMDSSGSSQGSISCESEGCSTQISEVSSRSGDSGSSLGLGSSSLNASLTFDNTSESGSAHSRTSIGLPTSYPTRVLNIERFKGNLIKNRHSDARDDFSDALSIGSRSAQSHSHHRRPSKSIGLPSAYPAVVSRSNSNASTVMTEDDIPYGTDVYSDWNSSNNSGSFGKSHHSSLPGRHTATYHTQKEPTPSPIFVWPSVQAQTPKKSSMPTPPIQSIMLSKIGRHRRSTANQTVFDEGTLSEIFSDL